MVVDSSVSMRVPRQTRESVLRLTEQTGETMTAVIAEAVRRFEDQVFYQRLAEATEQERRKTSSDLSYTDEMQSWMDADLDGLATHEEEKFWK